LFWLSFSWAKKFVFLLMAKERCDLLTLKEFRTRVCVCIKARRAKLFQGAGSGRWRRKEEMVTKLTAQKEKKKKKKKGGRTESKSLRLEMKGNRCV
jgi:hypothetical protein